MNKFKISVKAEKIIMCKSKKEADEYLNDYIYNNLWNYEYKIQKIIK